MTKRQPSATQFGSYPRQGSSPRNMRSNAFRWHSGRRIKEIPSLKNLGTHARTFITTKHARMSFCGILAGEMTKSPPRNPGSHDRKVSSPRSMWENESLRDFGALQEQCTHKDEAILRLFATRFITTKHICKKNESEEKRPRKNLCWWDFLYLWSRWPRWRPDWREPKKSVRAGYPRRS